MVSLSLLSYPAALKSGLLTTLSTLNREFNSVQSEVVTLHYGAVSIEMKHACRPDAKVSHTMVMRP